MFMVPGNFCFSNFEHYFQLQNNGKKQSTKKLNFRLEKGIKSDFFLAQIASKLTNTFLVYLIISCIHFKACLFDEAYEARINREKVSYDRLVSNMIYERHYDQWKAKNVPIDNMSISKFDLFLKSTSIRLLQSSLLAEC